MAKTFWVAIGYSSWTCCVDMVSRVVTPRETRAGTAFGSSQKLTLVVTTLNDDKVAIFWVKPEAYLMTVIKRCEH